ncbi:MAG: MMPL family transporter [Candidatus Latescibacteria bacterium]|nr:MMPL family transporter [Candidatus Latescibacterota bacterium]NIM21438.1 MMPL family transporter [Candidatus Latescibacterota bacterium]NIM65619.1 MMPL family transporter [Candidatus Latescibacterota bacterium]NIO02000.1 MMPL family transporter [Candidatus Latescibacterota bacterium]NIO28812.1 MMPL family transporter [Candidatus Latescibacterota bacterium]
MRSVVALAVRRRVSVIMTALAIAAFGFVGYQRLSLELFPDITYPSLTIQTDFPDTAPQEVENLITRPVEEVVGVLRGLQTIHSVSRPGVSEVTLEFDWGSDMDLLSMEVREKLDRLILPEEAEDPIVLRFDPSLDPVMRLALSGPGKLIDMRFLADKKLKPDFETIQGVAAAQIKGGLEEEIQVEVDQERLAALGIPIDRVRQVVGFSNINLPGGLLRGEDNQYLVRTVNEFETVGEIADLIIWQQGSSAVRLKDVAIVRHGAKEREEITRVNGQECVEIALFKEGDANAVTVAKLVRERLEEWKDKLPPGHTLSILFDQSHFIQQSISEVRNAALIGGLLAIMVLFAFLRDPRSTLIIATSIPLSVIATFMLMYRLDISLNIMSLGGLTLGIGMLVDNSIVVLESIFRKKKINLPLVQAAVDGTTEVGPAVAASTLTTVAVFLPIVFVEGVAGQLFKDQALTVTISLLASLVVAITMIPMLSALGGKLSGIRFKAAEIATGPILTLGRFSQAYDRFVRGAIQRRWLTVTVAFALFFAAMGSLAWIGTELIPPLDEGEFFFEVKMSEGTSLAASDRIIKQMEDEAAKNEEIERYYCTVGSRLVAGGMSLNTKAENLGQLNIVMKNRTDTEGESETAEKLRKRYEQIPDLEVKLGRPSYFSLKTPVEVILYGENLEDLRGYSLDLAQEISTIPGLVDVRSSLEAGNPELQVVFDRRRLASMGLDMGVLSETLKNRVQGVVPTRFKEEDRQIDIRIRNQEINRQSLNDVRNLVVAGQDGGPMRLLSVADVKLDRGPAEIHRLQQQRAAVVSANLKQRGLGSAVRDIEMMIRSNPPPTGITTEIGGQNREMQVSFASLRFALGLAIFLVYLVMAATFESFVHPFIVLFTIPLALVGVIAGLLATGTTITVVVLIGTIMLVGIVVNNAIVLIDAINRLRWAGVDKLEAVIRAGHIRLRPILMTTLTTILALMPMALTWGEGAELRSPLAITVASGLFLSTLLTLVVIPAVYMIVPSRLEKEEPLTSDKEIGS